MKLKREERRAAAWAESKKKIDTIKVNKGIAGVNLHDESKSRGITNIAKLLLGARGRMLGLNLGDADMEKQLGKEVTAKGYPEQMLKGYDALDKSGQLMELAKKDYAAYCALFYVKFGTWPDGAKTALQNTDQFWLYVSLIKEAMVNEWRTMKWQELEKAEVLQLFQSEDKEGYEKKFFETFGKYPTSGRFRK